MKPRVVLAGLPAGLEEWLRPQIPSIETRSVASVEEAADVLRATHPVLAIVGEELTGGTGEELVALARKTMGVRELPIIFCLGARFRARLARRLVHDHDVNRLLVHPPMRTELVDQIRQLLSIDPNAEALSSPRREVAAGVALLWERFRDQVYQRVALLEETAVALIEGRLDEEARRRGEREAHKLAGSVGMFGFAEGSAIARNAEMLLTGTRPLTDKDRQELAGLVRRLRAELEAGNETGGEEDQQDETRGTVFLVDAAAGSAEEFRAAAAEADLAVEVLDSGAARDRLTTKSPQLVVVDASHDDRWRARAELLHALGSTEPPIATFILGGPKNQPRRPDVSKRLRSQYLQKPVAPKDVITQGLKLVQRARQDRGRIVVVDDDPQVIEVVKTILAQEGYDVQTFVDPLSFPLDLQLDPPDILILDLDMPHINGIELCRIVRGDARWQGVPIVLMTANRQPDLVQRVFAAGADDFILKPVVGPELTTRVANRLERSRLNRAIAETDFLTGVWNRRKSTELFQQLIQIATREGHPLSFVILDLDRFKLVNDRHGHAVGDTVLREFAAFLQRMFRDDDVVGRWGGEEFVLGLYDMDREQAVPRLTQAIEEFSEISVPDGAGGTINVTFSAGVAEHQIDGTDLQSLYLAADRALYQAKLAGRARVHVATSDIVVPDPARVSVG